MYLVLMRCLETMWEWGTALSIRSAGTRAEKKDLMLEPRMVPMRAVTMEWKKGLMTEPRMVSMRAVKKEWERVD